MFFLLMYNTFLLLPVYTQIHHSRFILPPVCPSLMGSFGSWVEPALCYRKLAGLIPLVYMSKLSMSECMFPSPRCDDWYVYLGRKKTLST